MTELTSLLKIPRSRFPGLKGNAQQQLASAKTKRFPSSGNFKEDLCDHNKGTAEISFCQNGNLTLQDDPVTALQAAVDEQEGEGEQDSPKRIRPNPQFLTNVVSSISRTNQRLIAESTANAACKVRSTNKQSTTPRLSRVLHCSKDM